MSKIFNYHTGFNGNVSPFSAEITIKRKEMRCFYRISTQMLNFFFQQQDFIYLKTDTAEIKSVQRVLSKNPLGLPSYEQYPHMVVSRLLLFDFKEQILTDAN